MWVLRAVVDWISVTDATHPRCHGGSLCVVRERRESRAMDTNLSAPSGQYRRPSQKHGLRIFAQSLKVDRLSRKTAVNSVEIPCRRGAKSEALAVRAQGQGWLEQKPGWRPRRARGRACSSCPGSAAVTSQCRRGYESVIRIGSGNLIACGTSQRNIVMCCRVAQILPLPAIYTSHLPTLRGNRIDVPSFPSCLIYRQASACFFNEISILIHMKGSSRREEYLVSFT